MLPESQEKSLVANASDPEQVKTANRKDKDRRNQLMNDLREVESTEAGRRLLLHFAEYCSTFMSVWHDNPAQMAYNSGKQDVGHWLLAEMGEADPDMQMRLMQLKAERIKRDG